MTSVELRLPIYHPIHGFLISRNQIARRLAESLQPFLQGRIHIAAIEESLVEGRNTGLFIITGSLSGWPVDAILWSSA